MCITLLKRQCVEGYLMGLKDELSRDISIIRQDLDVRNGPIFAGSVVALESGAVKLDATILYATLTQPYPLTTDVRQEAAVKITQVFLRCMSRLIIAHGGTVASFSGDRIMGVFLGDMRNTNAATCALKMNYVTSKMIAPVVQEYFTYVADIFPFSYGIGIDTSPVMVTRVGLCGSTDLVWVGRAPNLAAKLSEIQNKLYHSYISENVFFMLFEQAKFGPGKDKELMWEESRFEYIGESLRVYRSAWNWEP